MTDTGFEKEIRSVFLWQEIPKDLMDRIDTALNQEIKSPAGINRPGIAVLAAGILLVVILALFMESNKSGRYQSLHQLTENAVIHHLKKNTAMSFTAEKMEETLAMIKKELGFNAVIPDLSENGYTLLGGRICRLDKCRTAYIFYKKNDTLYSLFILNDDHLGFEMADGIRFSSDIKECHTDIWKENGQVYAMVSSS